MDPETIKVIYALITFLSPVVTALVAYLSGNKVPGGAKPLIAVGSAMTVGTMATGDPLTSAAAGLAGIGVRELVDRGLKAAGARPR